MTNVSEQNDASTAKVVSVGKTDAVDATDPRFINRELAWLEFNQRVLEQASDESLPLLERVKFLAITGSNLDEFVMVRVGGLRLQRERSQGRQRDPSGMTLDQQLDRVLKRCHELTSQQEKLLNEELLPALERSGIRRVDLNRCDDRVLETAAKQFHGDVQAVLSPQALHDRQFPMLPGLGLNLCVQLQPGDELGRVASKAKHETEEQQFAIIPLGRTLPRIVALRVSNANQRGESESGFAYVLLEDLVGHFVGTLFPGRQVIGCEPFRITRNADIELREDGAGDLLGGMEEVLESRRQSQVVRLEIHAETTEDIRNFLMDTFDVDQQAVFSNRCPLDLTCLWSLHGLRGFDQLRDAAWPPQASPQIDPGQSMFSSIAGGDVMLIHPFESFDPVVRLIEEASSDPDVLAIKQILYRTSRNSPIVSALVRAAERDKYVTAIVELKARFDEARNIEWAREMEQAGVQVIYGIRGLKTHAKVCIIVRREPQGIVRYVHFGTGNYNEVTANLYSDVSLLTCDDALGADATSFFNAVTGASQPQNLQHLAAAPLTLRRRLLELIDGETKRSRQGQRAEITAKLNALVDTEVIDALYRASQAGVRIKLNVRGICCLRPGVPNLSDTIEVISVVDRFLEHARVVDFRHGGEHQVFVSSADWMPRNLDRRVELFVPVTDPKCRTRLRDMLQLYFRDTRNAWRMDADGQYHRITTPPNTESVRAQELLHQQAVDRSRKQTTRFQPHRRSQSD
ncbi:MAG: polyphosphate kinase 1 [Planctomycetota bacterium]